MSKKNKDKQNQVSDEMKEETKDTVIEDAVEEEKEQVSEEKKLDLKDEQILDLKDKLTRNMAEFDNFRKRTEKEKAQMYSIGAKDVIEKLLPIVDNFERALASVNEADKESPWVIGMDKIYKQTISTLEALGVTVIEAEGKEFDANFHNAVMHEENEEYGENQVMQELQKGYMYKETVIRHSMVKVAN